MARRSIQAIPDWILKEANKHWAIVGWVKQSDHREPILCDGHVVGFITPHKKAYGWSFAPVYVIESHRGMGLCAAHLQKYVDRLCVGFVADKNLASRAMFDKAGYEPWRRGNNGWFMRREPKAAP